MVGPTKVKDSVSAITLPSSGEWINVTSISGVVGDGTTDCYTALQAAITAAPGKVYYFPEGTFLLKTGSLTLGVGTTLRGAGSSLSILKNTSFTQFGGPIVDTGTGTGHTIIDLGFTYNGAGGSASQGSSTCMAIKVRSASKFRLENCRITCTSTVSAGVGIQSWFSPRSGAAAVSDYVIQKNTISMAGGLGLDVNSITSDGYFQDNNILQSASSVPTSAYFALSNNITVDGNSFTGPVGCVGCTNLSFLNNNIQVTSNPGASGVGAALDINNETGGTGTTNSSFIGNNITAGSYSNLVALLKIEGSASSDCLISNNILSGSGNTIYNGIDIREPNCTVIGNKVLGAVTVGIFSGTASKNCSIIGNYVKGSYQNGIEHSPSTATFSVHISNNVILDCNQTNSATNTGAAIYLNGGTDNHTVLGNHIKYSSIQPAYGVRGSALTAKSMVMGNSCQDAQTAAVSVNLATVAGNI